MTATLRSSYFALRYRPLKRRFVVLDRDGTINVECNYLSDPDQVKLIPGAAMALRKLNEMGLGLVVVTNQSAVGRGMIDHGRLALIHRRLVELLEAEGVKLDGIYVCPHRPEDHCSCRKPKTGLVEKASAELAFDPRGSFVIGDKACDMDLGRNLGATTLLVLTGYGAQYVQETATRPDYVTENLEEAVNVVQGILNQEGKSKDE